MSKRFAAPAVLCCLSLALPALAEAQSMPINCKQPKCVVTVIVGGNGCAGGIHVSKDPIVLPLGQQVDIEWNIPQEVDWEFDGSQGIVLYQAAQSGLSLVKEALAPKRYVLRLAPTKVAATYKYDVNLRKGGQACSLDPIIMTN